MNLDFDYVRYLDTLRRDGMNHTRAFTGAAYVEPQGAFNIERNSMVGMPKSVASDIEDRIVRILRRQLR